MHLDGWEGSMKVEVRTGRLVLSPTVGILPLTNKTLGQSSPYQLASKSHSLTLPPRDFPGGSLGLAWTANGENGGVCDTHRGQLEVTFQFLYWMETNLNWERHRYVVKLIFLAALLFPVGE